MIAYMEHVAAQEEDLGLHWLLRTAEYHCGNKVILSIGLLPMNQMMALLNWFVNHQWSYPILTEDESGALPLHIACEQHRDMPLDVIQFLEEQDRTTIAHEDHQGNLPIHVLCASDPRLNKVQYLLRKHPASIAALNHQGRSPFAVAALESASLEVVWYLIRADPDAALANLCRSA